MEWFERCGSGRIAPWLLAAWFVGLLLATPLYYPYPRLTLPWLAAAWLGTGGLFEVVNRRSLFRAARHGVSGRRVLGHGEFVHPTPSMAVTCGVLGLLSCLAAATCANHGATGRGMLRDSSAWQLRTGMAQVATNIAEQLPADGRATCYVFGEPALFFHLRRLDIAAVPVADLSFAVPRQRAGPTDFSAAPGMYLAIGSHAHSSPAFRQQWESVAWRFEKIKDIFWLPGDLVLLDESAPESDRRRAGRIEQVVTLYRIRPGIRR